MNKFNKYSDDENSTEFPGYPLYPSGEDVYNKDQVDADINPEDTSKNKTAEHNQPDQLNEKSFNADVSGDDLDVPGPKQDDDEEYDDDEENDYYSLGGDNHEAWEENNGD